MKSKKLWVLALSALMLTACGGTKDPSSSSEVSSGGTDSVDSSSFNNLDSSSSSSVIQGQVGTLTSAMIETIANASITVDGLLTDYYIDGTEGTTTETNYNMKVEMSEGAWRGSYWVDEKNVTVDNYRKGDIVNDGTNEGSGLAKVYIDKDNQVAQKVETLYDGTPLFWANQHLWNHLGQLDVNKFEIDEENQCYSYRIDPASTTDYSQDQYLMAYLGQSLTPLLSGDDGLIDTLYVYCNDTEITKMELMTEVTVLSTDEDGNPIDQSYSKVELTFSGIGTTVTPDPTPYSGGLYSEELSLALNKMKNLTNYTFRAVETTTSAPSGDSGDYEIESTSGTSAASLRSRKHNKVTNGTASTGTIGRVGKVTEDAILYADTGKYSYGLDDKLYWTKYSGLKQNDDGTYDEFEYQATAGTLVGTKKLPGSIFDKMPSFDFSSDVFVFDGGSFDKEGNMLFNFALRDSAIAQDVAPLISAHGNAKSATSSVTSKVTLTVSITTDPTTGAKDATIVSTSFPYSLVAGTYLGYVTTEFSDVGTTVLDEDLFDGYIPRTVEQSWSEYTDVTYYPTSSNQVFEKKAASEILEGMYGDQAANFITPADIVSVFGDYIAGPWHETNDRTDSDGNVTGSYQCFSFNLQSTELDSNNRITNWTDLMDRLNTVLSAKGYTISPSNTMDSPNQKYCTFINGDIEIVFENIGYKTIYVECYVTGDWTLNR
mgnify:FL=1